jgi:hypothetical protein
VPNVSSHGLSFESIDFSTQLYDTSAFGVLIGAKDGIIDDSPDLPIEDVVGSSADGSELGSLGLEHGAGIILGGDEDHVGVL